MCAKVAAGAELIATSHGYCGCLLRFRRDHDASDQGALFTGWLTTGLRMLVPPLCLERTIGRTTKIPQWAVFRRRLLALCGRLFRCYTISTHANICACAREQASEAARAGGDQKDGQRRTGQSKLAMKRTATRPSAAKRVAPLPALPALLLEGTDSRSICTRPQTWNRHLHGEAPDGPLCTSSRYWAPSRVHLAINYSLQPARH
jgi:hypothetical protein